MARGQTLQNACLYAINGGVDEMTVTSRSDRNTVRSHPNILDYDEVWDKYKDMMKWLSRSVCERIKYHSLYA